MKFHRSDGEVEGMLCVNIDHTRQSEFGAYIRHFSVVDRTEFSKALDMALDYIWKNLYADTVRIDLYHFEHDGKLQTDQQLKAALIMEKKGFKWKSLINKDGGSRFQIMQMSKPAGLKVSDRVAASRQMKVHQETIAVKSALAITFQKEESGKSFPKDERKLIEVPYNMMAALHRLKVDKNIPLVHRLNTKDPLWQDVDEFGEDVYQRGVRATMSGNPIEAMKDVKDQNIVLWVKDPAEQYLTSTLSSVYRLPPFDFSPIDGYCFLNIRNAQKIMYFAELKMYVISLASTLTQMVLLMDSEDK